MLFIFFCIIFLLSFQLSKLFDNKPYPFLYSNYILIFISIYAYIIFLIWENIELTLIIPSIILAIMCSGWIINGFQSLFSEHHIGFIFLTFLIIAYLFKYDSQRRNYKVIRRKIIKQINSENEDFISKLENIFPFYKILPNIFKHKFILKLKDFLSRVIFDSEYIYSLKFTEEMILLISSHACLLILNKPQNYKFLKFIMIFPNEIYKAKILYKDDKSKIETVNILGQSRKGTINLSWNHTLNSSLYVDGFNVAFHEFAHQLDQENDLADGIPEIEDINIKFQLMNALANKSGHFMEERTKQFPPVIKNYYINDMSEKFSIMTEFFFEQSNRMKMEFKELYKALSDYYQLDPSTWSFKK